MMDACFDERFSGVITTEPELRDILGHPNRWTTAKVRSRLDADCVRFIRRSPFLVLASAGASGQLDVSPKGDADGFVQVIDQNTLAFPDRSGNRRIDSFRNILHNPNVGLIFFVPGETDTLRAAGKAVIVRDAALRQSMALDGRIPELATVIRVERAYFHCGKCIARSKLWDRDNEEGVPAPRNGWQRVLGRKRVSR